HVEEILALIRDRSAGDGVRGMSGQHLRERALAGAVGAHDGMYLTGVHGESDSAKDLFVSRRGVKVTNFQHYSGSPKGERVKDEGERAYPTLPSRLTPRSFCASTANSMGSSLKTSLQKPFTIIEIAFSVFRPRCLR